MTDTLRIRDLADDELITEPGFYRISLERHHNQPCDGVSVTSSVLRKMELETPADVWAFHKLNPERYEPEDSDAFRMGRVMALFVEGGVDLVMESVMVLPDDKPNRPTAKQIAAWREGRASEAAQRSIRFWRKMDNDPREKITAAELATIVQMGDALARDPAASAALSGEPEITLAWRCEETGLWCLARPDLTAFSGMQSDYKTAAPAGSTFDARYCDRQITQRGYDMQMGFGAEGFELLTGRFPDAVGLVFQLKSPPYHTILRGISEEDLRMGIFRNQEARRLFASCLKSGDWWGPGIDVGNYQRPEWQREQLLERMGASQEKDQ